MELMFPEECLVSESSREAFAKIAAENDVSLAGICGYRGRGKCSGERCNFIPDVEPFPKKESPGLGSFPT